VDPIQADERRTWEEVTVTPLTSNLIRVFLLTVLFPTLLGFRTKLLVIDPILRWKKPMTSSSMGTATCT
jgi:hypothetical protein